METQLATINQIFQLPAVTHYITDLDDTFIEETEAAYTYKETVQKIFSKKLLQFLSSSTSTQDFEQACILCAALKEDFGNELFRAVRSILDQTTFLPFSLEEPVAKGRLCYYKAPITLVSSKKNEEYTLYVFDKLIELLSDDSWSSFAIKNVLRKTYSEGILQLVVNKENKAFKGFPQVFILNSLINQLQKNNG